MPRRDRGEARAIAQVLRGYGDFRSSFGPIQKAGCTACLRRKRYQMRHVFDSTCFLAKQVLSQLAYTPTVRATFILSISARSEIRSFAFRLYYLWTAREGISPER
jgi:hypothetical protein